MPIRLGAKVTKSDTHEIEINLTPAMQDGGVGQPCPISAPVSIVVR
jgi:hypothetical protein